MFLWWKRPRRGQSTGRLVVGDALTRHCGQPSEVPGISGRVICRRQKGRWIAACQWGSPSGCVGRSAISTGPYEGMARVTLWATPTEAERSKCTVSVSASTVVRWQEDPSRRTKRTSGCVRPGIVTCGGKLWRFNYFFAIVLYWINRIDVLLPPCNSTAIHPIIVAISTAFAFILPTRHRRTSQ
jgi:hypothetical protein